MPFEHESQTKRILILFSGVFTELAYYLVPGQPELAFTFYFLSNILTIKIYKHILEKKKISIQQRNILEPLKNIISCYWLSFGTF